MNDKLLDPADGGVAVIQQNDEKLEPSSDLLNTGVNDDPAPAVTTKPETEQEFSLASMSDFSLGVSSDHTFHADGLQDNVARDRVFEFAAMTQSATNFVIDQARIVQSTISATARFLTGKVLSAAIPANADSFMARTFSARLSEAAKLIFMDNRVIPQLFAAKMTDQAVIAQTQSHTFQEDTLRDIKTMVRARIAEDAKSRYAWTVGEDVQKAELGVVARVTKGRIFSAQGNAPTLEYLGGLKETDKPIIMAQPALERDGAQQYFSANAALS